MIAKLTSYWADDPVKAVALIAALVAMASTPIAFAVLGRLNWFEARRGRVMMRPSFISIIVGMMLVMGIPAIFAALVIKSADFDHNRYEFDPNKRWTVLEQGRRFSTADEADKAVDDEMKRLAEERKNLVDGVKKLDEAMLTLRTASSQSSATAQAIPGVLERLATIRRAVGVDGPQQLLDFTAPAVTGPIAGTGNVAAPQTGLSPNSIASASPAPSSGGTAVPATNPAAVAAPPLAPKAGLAKAEADAELSTVAEPQRPLASMLPLVDLPAGWEVGKYDAKHFETFNADNLYEKIDGRAESFTQNNVVGMAYTSYHPAGPNGDEAEVQVYIFEFDHAKPLRAQTKYNSEKPDEYTKVDVGTEGYASAGSLLFFADPYYTQIVSTVDDPKFAQFAEAIARRIAKLQQPAPVAAGEGGDEGTPRPQTAEQKAKALYDLLPAGPGKSSPQFVAVDVFGYGFLSDTYLADYKEGDASWQAFLRPYASADEAKGTLAKFRASAKDTGGEVKDISSDAADEMVISSSVGLVDVFFRRGSVVGGISGASDPARAEAFARDFARSLPADVPGAGPAR